MEERSISASYLVVYWDVTKDGGREAGVSLSTTACLLPKCLNLRKCNLKKKKKKGRNWEYAFNLLFSHEKP